MGEIQLNAITPGYERENGIAIGEKGESMLNRSLPEAISVPEATKEVWILSYDADVGAGRLDRIIHKVFNDRNQAEIYLRDFHPHAGFYGSMQMKCQWFLCSWRIEKDKESS